MDTLELPPAPATAPMAADDGYATIEQMRSWAWLQMELRRPNVVIGGDYLRRWWLVPRNPHCNLYLHEFLRSDDDRALHDHPWDNTSLLLDGSYIEHTPEGAFLRQPGDFVARTAGSLHRIELIDNQPVISLFSTGPKVRDWGFACPQGWVPWQQFCATDDPTLVGRGCGE